MVTIKTVKKDCCIECGFPIDIKRKPVFLRSNDIFGLILHNKNKCKNCGSQKSGWTIPCVYEHLQEIHNKHKSLIEEQKKEFDEYFKDSIKYNSSEGRSKIIMFRKILFGDSDNENNTNKEIKNDNS